MKVEIFLKYFAHEEEQPIAIGRREQLYEVDVFYDREEAIEKFGDYNIKEFSIGRVLDTPEYLSIEIEV